MLNPLSHARHTSRAPHWYETRCDRLRSSPCEIRRRGAMTVCVGRVRPRNEVIHADNAKDDSKVRTRASARVTANHSTKVRNTAPSSTALSICSAFPG